MPEPPEHGTTTARRHDEDWGYRSFFEHAVEGIFRTTPRGHYLQVNPALAHLYGFENPAQLIAELTDIAGQLYVDGDRRAEFARRISADGFVTDFVSEIRRRDGGRIWISEHARAVRGEQGQVVYYEGTVEDITARVTAERGLRESEERYRTLVEAAHNPIVIWRADGSASYANPAAIRVFGFAADGAGPRAGDLAAGEDAGQAVADLQTLFRGGLTPGRRERMLRRRDGAVVEVVETLTVVRRGGQPESVVAEYHDLSELHAAHRRLRDAVATNPLSGLPNRVAFLATLEAQLQTAHREHRGAAVIVVDLDRFKLVNDSLGHGAGDAVLREVARRLRTIADERDVVALGHLDGDEFAMTLDWPSEAADSLGIEGVESFARHALEVLAAPLTHEAETLVLSASAGYALFPDHAMQAEDLVARAERAMYQAKDGGGGRVQLGGDLEDHERARLRTEYELRRTADTGRFVLHYQPILDVRGGKIISVEALLRWPHPERGLLAPAEFIPLLEEMGVMEQVTYWVIDTACRQLAEWRAAGLFLTVAVNVPPRLTEVPSFVATVLAMAGTHGVPPYRLEFEITEGAAMEDMDSSLRGLHALRERGFRIAIDDFGVGHSSFARLREIPATKLKIDRSLVARVDTDPESRAILQGIVQMGRATALDVLAEGVETLGEFDTVVEAGVEMVQGYAVSRPVPPDLIPGLVANHTFRRRVA